MKRFIDIGNQVTEGVHEFAWWDTIVDRFESFNDCELWESVDSFINDFIREFPTVHSEGADLDHYLSLIPADWNKQDKEIA